MEALSRLDIIKILQDHKRYCEKQALIYLGKQDFHNAVRYEAKAEDTLSLEKLVEARIEEIREEK